MKAAGSLHFIAHLTLQVFNPDLQLALKVERQNGETTIMLDNETSG